MLMTDSLFINNLNLYNIIQYNKEHIQKISLLKRNKTYSISQK